VEEKGLCWGQAPHGLLAGCWLGGSNLCQDLQHTAICSTVAQLGDEASYHQPHNPFPCTTGKEVS
jgi:hypothetical protein